MCLVKTKDILDLNTPNHNQIHLSKNKCVSSSHLGPPLPKEGRFRINESSERLFWTREQDIRNMNVFSAPSRLPAFHRYNHFFVQDILMFFFVFIVKFLITDTCFNLNVIFGWKPVDVSFDMPLASFDNEGL